MRWVKGDNYYIKTDGFTIAKIFNKDQVFYELWQLPSTYLGKFENADTAKKYHLEFVKTKSALPSGKVK